MTLSRPIHPFPARMAPEIALGAISSLSKGSTVLDSMAGSGTVLRLAAEHGHKALGFDLDPLAVLLATVWTRPVDTDKMRALARKAIADAKQLSKPLLPWIDEDTETSDFVKFWFDEPQRKELRSLSAILYKLSDPEADALRVALSRLIITKDRGASLAGDISHSRPHRIRSNNSFPVIAEFSRSVEYLARLLAKTNLRNNAVVQLGDARNLSGVPSASVDIVITSPPYLNAINYLRGHKFALVWLGFRLSDLRLLRSTSIGVERAPSPNADDELARTLSVTMGPIGEFSHRRQRIIHRYALDMFSVISEIHRVLKPGGRAILVIGNSCHRGIFIMNSNLIIGTARQAGLSFAHQYERELPPNRRYLPPPTIRDSSDLANRMRTEVVLDFHKP